MLAAAMTNRGPMNTGGATPMQNPRNAPGFKQANQAALQQRLSALTPSQMQAHQQYIAANQQRRQAAPMQMQAANSNASLASAAYNQQQSGMMQAQNAFNQQQAAQANMAAQGAYNQQGGMMQGFRPAMGVQQPSSGQMAQNAQLEAAHRAASPQTIGLMNQAQQMGLDPYAALMNPSGFQQQYGMTMGGGGFNERGSASTPIGMHLSQLQAPYTSQPMAYGGRAVPVAAYMF